MTTLNHLTSSKILIAIANLLDIKFIEPCLKGRDKGSCFYECIIQHLKEKKAMNTDFSLHRTGKPRTSDVQMLI